MDVNPETLLFTQDSIKNTFKAPREDERIDDAVEAILRGDLEASDFPALTVVSYGGRLWSLDNRRLWVFKKARVPSVTVQLRAHGSSPRFLELITHNQTLMKRILEPGYWPRVRGNCRSNFDPPVQNFFNYLPVEPKPLGLVRSTSRCDHGYDYDSFVCPGLNNRRLVGPVRGLHGEGFPHSLPNSSRVATAISRPAVKVSDARNRENQFTSAEKTSDHEGGKPEIASGRREEIQMRRPAPQTETLRSPGKIMNLVKDGIQSIGSRLRGDKRDRFMEKAMEDLHLAEEAMRWWEQEAMRRWECCRSAVNEILKSLTSAGDMNISRPISSHSGESSYESISSSEDSD